MTAIRVLHVDDDPDICSVVEASLALDPDISTRSCESGEEALKIAASWLPDLILLDVMMPNMDGYETLAHLRENPATANINVALMTARALSGEIADYGKLGIAGVIAKPFDPMTLAATVHQYLPHATT